MKSVCVFCSSSPGKSQFIRKSAEELGKELAARKIRLIYGGSNMGLMGIVARSVLENNGEVVGIIPQKLYEKVDDLAVSKLIVVETMHQRKSAMFEQAEGFIALPGGIGTLEEISEVFTWLQLGYSTKPVGLLNADNYFDTFLDFLDVMVANGMLKKFHRDLLSVSSSAAEILESLNRFEPAYLDKWHS
jgi:uncharacterized protein (TIGR00730 family)